MSLIQQLKSSVSRLLNQVVSTSADLDAFLRRGLHNQSSTGIAVTADTAMQASAVYACVRVLAESVAVLPLLTYERQDNGGKRRANEHPIYRLLHDRPNSWQTAYEFVEWMTACEALRGNAYAFINRVRGEVRELLPIHPDRVTVEQDDRWNVLYTVTMPDGEQEAFSQRQIFHLKGLSSNGFTGLAPIQLAREAIGLSLATEKHGAKLFGNGARIGGILTHPGRLGEAAAKNLRESFEAAYSGLENAHRLMVTEENMTFTPVQMTAEDAQFLQTRQYQVVEIARIFRVPPHLIGDLSRATFSNIEHQSLEFVKYTLAPWLKRWEQAIQQQLMPPEDRDRYYCEFLVEGLLRGDFKTRVEGYASALQNGWLSVNDVRSLENLNPVEGGDTYYRQLNLTPVDGPVLPPGDMPNAPKS